MQDFKIIGKKCLNIFYDKNDEKEYEPEYDILEFITENPDNIVIHFNNSIFCQTRSKLKYKPYKKYYLANSINESLGDVVMNKSGLFDKILNDKYAIFDMVMKNKVVGDYPVYQVFAYTIEDYKKAGQEKIDYLEDDENEIF